jgi:pilus assembly protein CpaF
VKDIFRWVQTGKDPETHRFIGEMVPTGYVPTFFEEFVANKLPFPKTNFKAPDWVLPILKKAS